MHIRIEWGEAKRKSNLQKHGIDFVGSKAVFKGYTLTREGTRLDYGERRFVTLGLLEGRVVVVTHTETTRTIRIISIRKATRREQEIYFEGYQN